MSVGQAVLGVAAFFPVEALINGIAGIDQEVDDDILDLITIHKNPRKPLLEPFVHEDIVILELLAQDEIPVVDRPVHVFEHETSGAASRASSSAQFGSLFRSLSWIIGGLIVAGIAAFSIYQIFFRPIPQAELDTHRALANETRLQILESLTEAERMII